jgi:hypothetical protein
MTITTVGYDLNPHSFLGKLVSMLSNFLVNDEEANKLAY